MKIEQGVGSDLLSEPSLRSPSKSNIAVGLGCAMFVTGAVVLGGEDNSSDAALPRRSARISSLSGTVDESACGCGMGMAARATSSVGVEGVSN